MNAKELAELMRREAEISSKSYKQMILRSTARDIEKHLTPRYRPPQPSDDGKWCFLEQLPDFKGPHQIFANSTGEYWFDDVTAGEIKIVTKGVWPCERPEGGAT